MSENFPLLFFKKHCGFLWRRGWLFVRSSAFWKCVSLFWVQTIHRT